MDVKKNFIKVIKAKDLDQVQSLLNQSASKSSYFTDLSDFITATEHAEIWHCLLNDSIIVIEKLSSNPMSFDNENEMQYEDDDLSLQNECENCISFLFSVSKFMNLYCEVFPNKSNNIHLNECLQLFHDILVPLNNEISKAVEFKNSISKLCESKWLANASGSEAYVTQLLPYLVLQSLLPNASDNDIKRVFGVRNAIELFDFEDSSIESLRGLLLRCFIHPSYLKLVDGRRFLAYVMNINETNMHQLVLGVMKPQILDGTKSVCLAYGDVLLRAWKDASVISSQSPKSITNSNPSTAIPSKQLLEESLQMLISEAIHTSSRKQFKGIRLVLSVFHDLKSQSQYGVDSLIYRLYAPIIWRSLKCANAIIRSQAAIFFFDIFPLQDPSLTSEGN